MGLESFQYLRFGRGANGPEAQLWEVSKGGAWRGRQSHARRVCAPQSRQKAQRGAVGRGRKTRAAGIALKRNSSEVLSPQLREKPHLAPVVLDEPVPRVEAHRGRVSCIDGNVEGEPARRGGLISRKR